MRILCLLRGFLPVALTAVERVDRNLLQVRGLRIHLGLSL